MDTDPDEIATINRALGYPYSRPDTSFLFSDGKALPLSDKTINFSDLIPVIACGSNASPLQLARKFAGTPQLTLPVTRIHLHDFICSFSAHLTAYGSIPATLTPKPGHQMSGHITWLTEAQLAQMHGTEALGTNYKYSRLEGLKCTCEVTGPIHTLYAYISKHGHFGRKDKPIGLSELNRSTKLFTLATQAEVQQTLIDHLQEHISLEEFILSNIKNENLRQHRIQKLSRFSTPFQYQYETVLAGDFTY